jgi:hypothetical protein
VLVSPACKIIGSHIYANLQNQPKAVWMVIENYDTPYCFTLDGRWDWSRNDRKYSLSR